MRKTKRFLSLLMIASLLAASVSMGIGSFAAGAGSQSISPFTPAGFRRPSPQITLDVSDVVRVGASGDTTMGAGNTIKKATPSGVPYITGTYASHAYAGETPVWPKIVFTASLAVNIVSVNITGASASATLTAGSLSNTTSATWEIQGGTSTAGNTMKVSITYTYTWSNPYTGISVTDTYVANGYSYVENIIFPAGVWSFTSAYSNIDNAADVPYISRILGRGVYGGLLGLSSTSGDYRSGYFNFSLNSTVATSAGLPERTMLIADPPHKGAYDQYINNGTGTYAGGDPHRAKAIIYLDPSVQTMQSNNVRMHFFIHSTSRSTDSGRDLTYETIHVRDNDTEYSGSTENVLGTSSSGAKAALNPSGPVDGTTSEGGHFITAGMQTQSTLYGTGAPGLYTLITQWTGKGDTASSSSPNWMQYYHGVTVEIISVNKSALRSALNTMAGTATKAFNGSNGVTTIVTANGTDPANGGIANTGKGKNPQSWYYSSGWDLYTAAYDGAWTAMNKPNANQTAVTTAINNLNGAYESVVLRGANYTDRNSQYLTPGLGNTYYNSTVYPLNTTLTAVANADASFNSKLAFWKAGSYDYYTTASRTALEEAYTAAVACQTANYNVLYQPYVDHCAKELQTAVNNLVLKTNNVTFNANGGSGTMAAQAVTAGSTVNLNANAFTKTGYTFAGWATSSSGAVAYADGGSFTMGSSGVTLYAKWNANTYTVSYNGNTATGGSTISSVHTYDQAKQLNANGFTKTGYSFLGWNTLPTAATAAYTNQQSVTNLTAEPNATVVLYAVWSPTVYNIVFNPNGATGTMANQGIAYQQSAPLTPNAFNMTGCRFLGWATSQANADAGTVSYADGANYTMATAESKILYAVWAANTYDIIFHANASGVSGSMPNQSIAFGATENLNPNTFTKTGYTFLGWATEAASAKAYDDGAAFTMNSAGEDLYAKWSANGYTVVYNANGGSAAPASHPAVYDTSFNIPAAGPVRAGYTFLGWAAASNATAPSYTSGQSVSNLTAVNGATVTLYAVWQANTNTVFRVEHYRESLAKSYELYETTTQTGTTGTVGTAIYKTYPGFVSNTSYPSTVSSGIIAGNGSLLLRVYYDRVTVTISFNTNGGTAVSPISGKYGVTCAAPANPTRTGYQFAGWTPAFPDTFPAANVTLAAQWTANSYNVVFNGNGATGGTMAPLAVNFGASAALTTNAFTRAGYTFAGWATAPAGAKEYDNGANFTMNTPGATLYAVWVPAAGTPFTVEHWLQNVSGSTYALGQTTIQTGTTGQVGVAQWQTLTGFTQYYAYEGNVTAGIIAGDGSLVLKLYYTRNSYTLTFSGAEGLSPITAKYGQQIALPAAAPRTGYNIAGWYKDAGFIQLVSWPYAMAAADTTLYAKWAPNTYNIAFDPDGGTIFGTTGVKSSTVVYDSTYGAGTLGFPVPEKTGYTFNGWFTAEQVQVFTDTAVKITAPVTLTASWTALTATVDYDLNGAAGTPPQSVTDLCGTSVDLPLDGYSGLRTGYTLLGWNTDPGAVTALSNFEIPEGGATLYAVWKINQYTVTYSLNGAGGLPPSPVKADYGTPVNVSQTGYTRTGYTFGGWALIPNGAAGDKLTSFTVPAGDVTLYAIWLGNSHTVTLFANGGVGPTSVQISTKVGATVDLSGYNNYTKTNYTMVGWSTSQTATTGFWSYTVPATSVTLLFAVYAPVAYTVTFDANGGNGGWSAPMAYGSALTAPEVSREGYTFTGWSPAVPPTVLAANAVYTAQWSVNSYVITFDANGGTGGTSGPLVYGSPLTPPAVVNPGYVLAGWEPALPATVPAADTTYTAQWVFVSVSLTARDGSTTVVDTASGILYGREEGLTNSGFSGRFAQVNGDGSLRYTYANDSFGTGTVVELIDNATGIVLETYTIVIFGDVDGDGYITAADENLVDMVSSYQIELAGAFLAAADLTRDGFVDAFDLNILSAATGYTTVINQANPAESA